MKDSEGRRLFKNYSQQRKFRESQEFMRLRFNVRSMDPAQLVDAGSDLEAAAAELAANPDAGRSGTVAYEAKDSSRLGRLLAAQGAPDYYFFRYWYSETQTR